MRRQAKPIKGAQKSDIEIFAVEVESILAVGLAPRSLKLDHVVIVARIRDSGGPTKKFARLAERWNEKELPLALHKDIKKSR